jgi:hypothetical protein
MAKFFKQFFQGKLNLEAINRSYMILSRKKENDSSPGSYIPISFINCTVKWINKVLAARLQPAIELLVDEDQSSCFKTTRCIVMYAMDLVQTCRKRKMKTMILKLDLSKVFDRVSWDALFSIMHGF